MRAVVDIGSNTIKVLIAEVRRGEIINPKTFSRVARLAEGLKAGQDIKEAALKRATLAFEEIDDFIKKNAESCMSIDIVATAALRKASNAQKVIKIVENIFSKKLEIISGQEEARISMIGSKLALAKLNLNDANCVFFDLGGASTEISISTPTPWSHSFEIGAVSAHNILGFPTNKISDKLWDLRTKKLDDFFSKTPIDKALQLTKNKSIAMAAGGTLVQLANAMKCQQPAKNIYKSDPAELNSFLNKIRSRTEEERILKYGIEKGRADILPAGTSVFEYLCTKLKLEQIIISSFGIRHGFLIDRYNSH